MTMKFRNLRRFLALVMASAMAVTMLTACGSTENDADVTEEEEDMIEVTEEATESWLAAWGTSMQTVWSSDTIPSEATSGKTVTIRQQIRPSVSGNELRFTLSNQCGSTDLVIDSMEIAMLLAPTSYEIDTDSSVTVTYEGSTTITVPAGETIVTDAVEFPYSALDDIAVSMEISSMPSTITLHRASRCTNWIITGSHVSDNDWSGASTYAMWYFLAVMDVKADENSGAAIVCLGDSLTDGASIVENSFTRYTDALMELMQEDLYLQYYSVINMGVGGTNFLGSSDNSTGLGRVTRDIVNISGVKYCVVLMGVNDIGGATTDISADIIAGYETLVEECHEAGITVIGCTITPFNGSSYYSELHEEIRQTVNEYIMSEDSAFDGYVDLASAVASEADSSKMDSSYVSTWNDYLHFNATGYGLLGSTIYDYLTMFI
ncbi:MAG: GDSL-type esterase/lipase family protein [Oscillospiraceae bacterium]|nr:GDSL-type esterase/lipase family protein [Oscillospiraceae bacterium]